MIPQDIRALVNAVTVVDFETEKIGPRPHQYPPRPVGVAIRWPEGGGGNAHYYAWGHASGNNCTFEAGASAVELAFRGPVLFHNAKFDLEVAWKWLRLPVPRYWHDTLFMLFLHDAHAPNFQLKPAAERLLSEPLDEKNAMRDWIVANVPGARKGNFMEFIALAPGTVVSPYALGDVHRTFKLFAKLAPAVLFEQYAPYNRERRLMPFLVQAEQRGVRVDRAKLQEWEGTLDHAITTSNEMIYTMLGTRFNIDSNDELADVLTATGNVKVWEYTEKGMRKTSKDALERCIDYPALVHELACRGDNATRLNTFVRPWLDASAIDGRLHTQWHQVRGQDKNGTRTGRIASSEPNLANVAEALRSALLPEEGEVWVCADYNSQELRIAAHYEDGAMLRTYQDTPRIDQHMRAAELVAMFLGVQLTTPEERKRWRRICKTTGFLLIYGGGVPRLAEQLKCPLDEAFKIRNAYFGAVPGLRQVIARVQQHAAMNGFVTSLGGRKLTVEPPKMVGNEMRTFLYKMFNKLVQGSASDQTKEAIIKFGEAGTNGKLLATVYDEIDISVPQTYSDAPSAVLTLKDCMVNALPCDTPMLVDLEYGDSWGTLREMGGV